MDVRPYPYVPTQGRGFMLLYSFWFSCDFGLFCCNEAIFRDVSVNLTLDDNADVEKDSALHMNAIDKKNLRFFRTVDWSITTILNQQCKVRPQKNRKQSKCRRKKKLQMKPQEFINFQPSVEEEEANLLRSPTKF